MHRNWRFVSVVSVRLKEEEEKRRKIRREIGIIDDFDGLLKGVSDRFLGTFLVDQRHDGDLSIDPMQFIDVILERLSLFCGFQSDQTQQSALNCR